MNSGDLIVFRRCQRIELKSGILVTWVSNSEQNHCFWDALKCGHISDVNIGTSGTCVDGQLKNTFIELVLGVKEINDSPPETDELVLRPSVWFWNLQLNEEV